MARLLLPKDDDGIAFARIRLALCEAGRAEGSIAAVTAFGEGEQRAMVDHWLPHADRHEVRAVDALVTGLRAQLCGVEPLSPSDAFAATAILRR